MRSHDVRRPTPPVLALACSAVLGACGGGGGDGGGGGPGPGPGGGTAPTTFQAAVVAIGQPNLTSNTPGTTPSASNLTGITGASGNPAVNGTTLYVSDPYWHRILGFNTIPAASGASADFVVGQAAFNTGTSGLSATKLNFPEYLHAAGGKLFVGDRANNRVLVYDPAPTATGAAATLAVGQPDLTTKTPACSQSGMSGPEGVWVTGTKLIVAEYFNRRVLIWNTLPTTSGAPADLVLGQPDFTTCASGDPSASTLDGPQGVWSDGTRLLVADGDNNRVLVWTTFPTSNGEPADLVLGQPDMTSNAPIVPPTASSLNLPYSIASDGTRLFIGTWNDMRVLVWNTFPTASNAPASAVLGQSDFVHRTENDDDQNGVIDDHPTARTLRPVRGLCLVGSNKLIVNDGLNWRYLVHTW